MKNTKFKTNKTKLIAIMMLLVIILSTIVTTGCEFFVTKEIEQTTENSQKEVINHEPQDLIDGLITKMQSAGYDKMEAIAEFFFQCGHISSVYNYSVEIIDGKMYLNGYVYDVISYVADYDLVYENSLLSDALSRDVEKYDILLKIQNQSGCYILQPQEENGIGFKIVVYDIEGDYYFLASYYSGEVQKIHKVSID